MEGGRKMDPHRRQFLSLDLDTVLVMPCTESRNRMGNRFRLSSFSFQNNRMFYRLTEITIAGVRNLETGVKPLQVTPPIHGVWIRLSDATHVKAIVVSPSYVVFLLTTKFSEIKD